MKVDQIDQSINQQHHHRRRRLCRWLCVSATMADAACASGLCPQPKTNTRLSYLFNHTLYTRNKPTHRASIGCCGATTQANPTRTGNHAVSAATRARHATHTYPFNQNRTIACFFRVHTLYHSAAATTPNAVLLKRAAASARWRRWRPSSRTSRSLRT